MITDSNAHFTPQEEKELGISVVPMPFTIGDKTFYEGVTLSREEFYAQMESGANIVTSQPSPSAVMDIWDKALETHDEVVYIPMSSGLSGSCQSARMLADDYDGKVQVVNNQRISVTQKRSVQDALEMAQRGMSAAQIRQELEHVKYESSIYIMLDTLYYLKKGGRITPAAAAVGTLMRIKPVLQIKGERLDAFSKARTLAQGKSTMINAIHHDIDNLFGGIDAGSRNDADQTEQDQHAESVKKLLADILHAPRVFQGFPHRLLHLNFPTRCLDLFLRGFSYFVHGNGELFGQLAAAQDFHAIQGLFDQTGVHQGFRSHGGAVFEALQGADVDSGVFLAVDVGEAALGQTAGQRHLAAFKSRALAAAGAGFGAFVALTGRFAESGAYASAEALRGSRRADGRLQLMQFHWRALPYSSISSTFTMCLTAKI